MITRKLAYSVEEAGAASNQGRTKIYKAIEEGKLLARKNGRRTIILTEDLEAYLHALPLMKGE